MKSILLILLITILCIFSSLSRVETQKQAQLNPQHKVNSSVESKASTEHITETAQNNMSSTPVNASLEDYEADYKGIPSFQLRYELIQIEKNIEDQHFIDRANKNTLSKQERTLFEIQIKKTVALRKILIEREIEALERDNS